MANPHKKAVAAKAKAAPAITPPKVDAAQNQENGTSHDHSPALAVVASPDTEPVKPAQVAKKEGKEQKAQELAPPEEKTEKVKAGKVKAGKGKEAKSTVEESSIALKKSESESASEKSTKMKRLTLDIAKPLHKAIKAKAVEEGVPMVDMLRSLLEEHYGK
jgi:predicted DNA binding CopG/RHH family protein